MREQMYNIEQLDKELSSYSKLTPCEPDEIFLIKKIYDHPIYRYLNPSTYGGGVL